MTLFWEELSSDRGSNGNVLPPDGSSRKEAMSGLEAVDQGLIPGPLQRYEDSAFEFVDAEGMIWDVKTFPGNHWSMPAHGTNIQNKLLRVITNYSTQLT